MNEPQAITATRGKALAQWRKRRSVELALSGLPYDEIAADVGYKNRGTAWNVVQKALQENLIDDVEHYRSLELARLESLLSSHWEDATANRSTRSADLCLRIVAQQSKLLALETQQVTVQTAPTIVQGANYVASLKAIAGDSVA